jgi:hypothetical protein
MCKKEHFLVFGLLNRARVDSISKQRGILNSDLLASGFHCTVWGLLEILNRDHIDEYTLGEIGVRDFNLPCLLHLSGQVQIALVGAVRFPSTANTRYSCFRVFVSRDSGYW